VSSRAPVTSEQRPAPRAPAASARPRRRRIRREQLAGYAFIAPAVAVAGAFLLYPALRAGYISLTDWNLLSDPEWLGLDNFGSLAGDRAFRNSLLVTLYYVGGTTALTIPIAFALAVGLRSVGRLQRVFASIYFLPVMLSTVISSVLFVSVFHPHGGVLRLLPLPFGLSDENWYQSSELVIPALILFSLWKGLGLYVVIFLAALEELPVEPAEAARAEGASGWQVMRFITIPLMKPIFLFAAVVSVIFSFQNFAIVYASTKGGPGNASEILPILIYETAFRDFDMGAAAAISMVLFAIVGVLTVIQFRVLRSRHG
jgi:multiple sugar transport system permease protein